MTFSPVYHCSHFFFPFCRQLLVGKLPLYWFPLPVLSSDPSTKSRSLVVSSHPLYISTHNKQSSQLPFHPLPIIDTPRSPFSGYGAFWGTAEHQLKDMEGCFSKTQQTDTTQVKLLSSGLPQFSYGEIRVKKRIAGSEKTGCFKVSAIPFPLLFLLPWPIYLKKTLYVYQNTLYSEYLLFGSRGTWAFGPKVMLADFAKLGFWGFFFDQWGLLLRRRKALVQICEINLYWDFSWRINI